MAMVRVPEFPVTAKPARLVAMPGMEAGEKVTMPSRAEMAVEVCVASKGAAAQRPRGGQGGVQA